MEVVVPTKTKPEPSSPLKGPEPAKSNPPRTQKAQKTQNQAIYKSLTQPEIKYHQNYYVLSKLPRTQSGYVTSMAESSRGVRVISTEATGTSIFKDGKLIFTNLEESEKDSYLPKLKELYPQRYGELYQSWEPKMSFNSYYPLSDGLSWICFDRDSRQLVLKDELFDKDIKVLLKSEKTCHMFTQRNIHKVVDEEEVEYESHQKGEKSEQDRLKRKIKGKNKISFCLLRHITKSSTFLTWILTRDSNFASKVLTAALQPKVGLLKPPRIKSRALASAGKATRKI